MKLGNWIPVTVALLMLGGCATTNQDMAGLPSKAAPALADTEQYLPTLQFDENGKRLPYQASLNPYLSEQGKVNRGSVLLFIEAQQAMKKEDYKTAVGKLKVITDQDSTLAGPWALLGEISLKRKQFELAETQLRKAIQITPSHMAAYSMLAMAMRNQGKFHQAQNTLAKALKQWPDFPEAHLNLGILYDIYLNQPEKAQQHIEAYQFLTSYSDPKAQEWLNEIQQRTGIALRLNKKDSSTQASKTEQGVNRT